MHFDSIQQRPLAPPARQCPTPAGDLRPLIAHVIDVGVCLARQREFYHKCHRCIFRGKPAGFVPPQPPPGV